MLDQESQFTSMCVLKVGYSFTVLLGVKFGNQNKEERKQWTKQTQQIPMSTKDQKHSKPSFHYRHKTQQYEVVCYSVAFTQSAQCNDNFQCLYMPISRLCFAHNFVSTKSCWEFGVLWLQGGKFSPLQDQFVLEIFWEQFEDFCSVASTASSRPRVISPSIFMWQYRENYICWYFWCWIASSITRTCKRLVNFCLGKDRQIHFQSWTCCLAKVFS